MLAVFGVRNKKRLEDAICIGFAMKCLLTALGLLFRIVLIKLGTLKSSGEIIVSSLNCLVLVI